MSIVTGFYREAGLYLRCPHCRVSTKVSITELFFAFHRKAAVVCVDCKKNFYVELRALDTPCLTSDEAERTGAADGQLEKENSK